MTELTDDERHVLDADGFVVLTDLFTGGQLTQMRVAVEDALRLDCTRDTTKPTAGTLHVHLDDEAFETVRASSRLRSAVTHLLGSDWSLIRLALRAPRPGYGAQALHGAAALPPANRGVLAGLVTAIIPLVDFTVDNGATRVVSGSHRSWTLRVPRNPEASFRGERVITAPRGSGIVFPEALVHSGTTNRSAERRDSLQVAYTTNANLNLLTC